MSSISVEYINPFVNAAQHVCATAMKLPIVAGKPRLVEEGERLWKLYQVSAMIVLSEAVKGVVLVSFSERVAIALASQLAETNFTEIDNDCMDALREISNLIVGTAKRDLPSGLITISPPKIVETRQVVLPITHPTIILPFDISMGRFVVQVALEKTPLPKPREVVKA